MEKRIVLLSANIIGFGKIKNLKLDFSDGFNVIYGFNEAGKSTIMRFFKAMLYGLEVRRRSGESVKERELAVPWGEKTAEGILNIGFGKTELEIRRSFGMSAAEDDICVFDSVTGNKVNALCVNDIGAVLFGFSKDVFLRTVMITQNDVFMGGKAEEITARLMNMHSSMTEEISADTAIERLSERANALKRESGRRNLGKIDAAEQRRTVLLHEKYDLKTQLSQAEKIEERSMAAKAELAGVRNEIRGQEKKLSDCIGAERTASGDNDALIYECKSKISALSGKEIYTRCADLTKETCLTAMELENKIAACGDTKSIVKNRRPIYTAAALIIICAVCGVAFRLYGASKIFSYIFSGISVASAIAEFYMIKKERRKPNDEKPDDDLRKLTEILAEYSAASADELMQMYIEVKSIKDTVEELNRMIDGAAAAKNCAAERSGQTEISSVGLQDSLRELHSREVALVSEIKGLESRMAYEVRIDRLPSDIDTEINAVNDEICRLEKEYKATILAKAIIASASESLRKNFAPVLNKRATEILNRLKDDDDGDIRISDEFYALFSRGAKLCKAECLSRGAYEQLYFAVRYALSEIICLNSPFFADDILSVYDDKRADSALRFLSEQKERQILLFTCKGFEAENAKEFGANIIYIN